MRMFGVLIVAAAGLLPLPAPAQSGEQAECDAQRAAIQELMDEMQATKAKEFGTGCNFSFRRDSWTCRQRMEPFQAAAEKARPYYNWWVGHDCYQYGCINTPFLGRDSVDWITESHRC